MTGTPVYFDMQGGGHWAPSPLDRAFEWTRVFHRRKPSIPGTVVWMVRPNLERGIPAGFTDWAERARIAESLDFTPERYEQYFAALDELDPAEFAAHPDNHKLTRGLRPVRSFDPMRAAQWVQLVDHSLRARDAARISLTGTGEPEHR